MNTGSKIYPLLALALALLLSACGSQPAVGSDSIPSPAPQQGAYDIPGEETAVLPPPAGDGLAGSYYNDYLRQLLTLDGEGGCTLSYDGAEAAGSYTAAEDGSLRLLLDSGAEDARIDSDGDVTITGRTGYFLRDWDFWGITETEAGTSTLHVSENVSETGLEDGSVRYRDFDNSIAFSFPADMNVVRHVLIGGVAVSDGSGGCVVGRNVTELYSTHSGTDDEFLEDYIRTFVFSDFSLLYDGLSGFDSLTLLREGIEGRRAAATLRLSGGSGDMDAKIILYTSTYADGTQNFICKSVFAPVERENGVELLEQAVRNMGAVRLIPSE